jgi:cation diffusion facilitator CzcD-associated flavoprotein CzcO
MSGAQAARDFPIAILGAGFAGIGTAVRLKKAGIHSFTIFERAGDVGGTWRDNSYPGAACDVPSHVYSLSFEPNPHWSRRYSPSREIWEYLRGIVDKWQLAPHIRFHHEIVEARFDQNRGLWFLTPRRGPTVSARFVVSCVGGLVDPKLPDIKGLASFGGELFHTARWKHDYDLAGRRVAVIGTGASAVQVVPSIAPEVEQLYVFQRTPGWVMPRKDAAYSARARRLFARYPMLLKVSRVAKYLRSELRGPMVILDSERLSRIGERMSLRHLEQQVRDPELRAKLTPTFQFGCKRILISDDYWATFERPNVELVTDPIDEITPTGLRTRDGALREVDAIILATGFDVGITRAPFPIVGRGGQSLDEAWQHGAAAYKGMAVSGFPNWFILMGPNTGPGHTSVLVYTEAQIAHVLAAIRTLRDEGLKYVDVRQVVQNRYNRGIQRRMPYMVWTSGCDSWYLSKEGRNHSLFPGLAAEYVLRTRHFRPRDYEIAGF